MSVVKEKTKKMIDGLPEGAARDDVAYELYVKEKLARALEEAAAGKVVLHDSAKQELIMRGTDVAKLDPKEMLQKRGW